MSVPGAAMEASVKRTASVPYCSMISIGSMTLPLVFDIFCRSASRTSAWMYTVLNGTSPCLWSRMKWQFIMIMRATQKNRMSKPVTSSDVG